MIITNEMRAVIIRIQRTKIDPNYISPNLVADIAWNMGKKLTSDQIVYISDNYQIILVKAKHNTYIHGIKLIDMIMKLLVVLAGLIGILAIAALLAFGIVMLMIIVDDKLN